MLISQSQPLGALWWTLPGSCILIGFWTMMTNEKKEEQIILLHID